MFQHKRLYVQLFKAIFVKLWSKEVLSSFFRSRNCKKWMVLWLRFMYFRLSSDQILQRFLRVTPRLKGILFLSISVSFLLFLLFKVYIHCYVCHFFCPYFVTAKKTMKAYKTLYSITKDQEASRYIPIATIPYFCREVPAEFRANSKTGYVIGNTIFWCIINVMLLQALYSWNIS